jgi:hypothetical protein
MTFFLFLNSDRISIFDSDWSQITFLQKIYYLLPYILYPPEEKKVKIQKNSGCRQFKNIINERKFLWKCWLDDTQSTLLKDISFFGIYHILYPTQLIFYNQDRVAEIISNKKGFHIY